MPLLKYCFVRLRHWSLNYAEKSFMTLTTDLYDNVKNQGPYSQHFIFFVTYDWAR
jgi:hypothetical protein